MKWKWILLNFLKEKHLWEQNEYIRPKEVNIQITEGYEFMYKR
jgi:hypothetical protein